MSGDWQSWAALAVVGVTVAAFLSKFVKPKKRGGGCGTCGSAGGPATPGKRR